MLLLKPSSSSPGRQDRVQLFPEIPQLRKLFRSRLNHMSLRAKDLATAFFHQDRYRGFRFQWRAPTGADMDAKTVNCKLQQRDDIPAANDQAAWKSIRCLNLETGCRQSGELLSGIGHSHLVAAEVLVVEVLEPFAQLFLRDTVGGCTRRLGRLQNLVGDEDGAIHA